MSAETTEQTAAQPAHTCNVRCEGDTHWEIGYSYLPVEAVASRLPARIVADVAHLFYGALLTTVEPVYEAPESPHPDTHPHRMLCCYVVSPRRDGAGRD